MPDDAHVELDQERPASDPDDADDDAPAPLRAKVISGLIGIAVLFGSGWLLLRISSPAIAPGQKAPAGHYPLSCPVCHSISAVTPATGEQ
jgi:hypothetical protein